MTHAVDWQKLGFQYMEVGRFLRSDFRGGSWTPLEVCEGPSLNLNIAAICLHYGQACFEGLKAFRRKDGVVSSFRPDLHARRLVQTAVRLAMEPPPVELFLDAVKKIVRLNRELVPPYGTGASFYIRPLLIGTSPAVGVDISKEYSLIVFGVPVGPYYRDGMRAVKAYVQERYDRAAPRGLGHVKAAANYAAGLVGDREMRAKGYQVSLYLDACTHSFIEEFGTSNFIAIGPDKQYVTPASDSVLRSVTNDSLQQLAADLGYTVERRPVAWGEIDNFIEVGACGTAAVITPVNSITRGEEVHRFGEADLPGPHLQRLYQEIQDVQYGRTEDRHSWLLPVD
jgi:branched-chain amino acid aminotransferase